MPTTTSTTENTPKSIYSGVNRIQWEDQTLSFETFLSQSENGKWDHNPPHQRDVVHPPSWGSRIIDSAIWFGELPQLYFHPRETPTGTIYESLDGKQRASQVLSFMKDGFSLKTSRPEFKHINGKTFSQLDKLNQNEIRDLKLRIRLANRTLTQDEIYQLFSRLQDNKRTTTGEQLNAMPGELDVLVQQTYEAATELFDTLIPNDKRKKRCEIICRCLKSWDFSCDDAKALTDRPKLSEWYQKAVMIQQPEHFIKSIIETLQALQDSNLNHRNTMTTILPIFRLISECVRSHPTKLCSLRDIIIHLPSTYFQTVAGEHNASLTRYNSLIKTTEHLFTN